MPWPKSMAIVEVLWDDSMAHGGWKTVRDWTESNEWGMACRSVGWLFRHTRQHLVLMQSQSELGHLAEAIEIPRSAVRQVRVLERGYAPRKAGVIRRGERAACARVSLRRV